MDIDLKRDRSTTINVYSGKHSDGGCQGCGDNLGVYVIEARSWQTRFCWTCLTYIYEKARKL